MVTDITDLDGGTVAQVEFPNPNDLTNFSVVVSPDSGCWSGAKYHFTFAIPALYPHEPPKVTCNTKIYHPNINLEGAVCLNILREDWKPVLDINAVIYGLIYLFYEPNPDDPLNREAADLYRSDKLQVNTIRYRYCLPHSSTAPKPKNNNTWITMTICLPSSTSSLPMLFSPVTDTVWSRS
jgi:ubiquitin-protein ligase